MHEHTEKTCKHELVICAECGNVYCSKCGKEWFKEQYTTPAYPYALSYTPQSGSLTVTTVSGYPVKPTHTHAN